MSIPERLEWDLENQTEQDGRMDCVMMTSSSSANICPSSTASDIELLVVTMVAAEWLNDGARTITSSITYLQENAWYVVMLVAAAYAAKIYGKC